MRRKKRKRHLDLNDARDRMIDKLDMAIEVAEKSHDKTPRQLYRYRSALERLRSWQKKFNTAQERCKHYGDKVKYYEKRFNVHGADRDNSRVQV